MDLLAGQEIGGFHQVAVDGDAAFVVQIPPVRVARWIFDFNMNRCMGIFPISLDRGKTSTATPQWV